MEEDKSPLTKILFVLFIISTLVVGVIYVLSLGNKIQFSKIIPSFTSSQEEKDYGYNFELPAGIIENMENAGTTEEPETEETVEPIESESTDVTLTARDEILTPKQMEEAFNYQVEEGTVGTILIPAIGVNSPVISGNDGESILDHGFWLYPSTNLPGHGESILLCHRRFFKESDPRSCWNLNLLQAGDLIQVNDNNNKPVRFIVKSVTVKSPDDLNIYKLSNENYLKLVSCTLENGKIGGSTHRIVVVAEKVD